MKESPQQYTTRILGHSEGMQPLAVQSTTAKKIASLIKGVSLARLRKRPSPDKWSVNEIVIHLADAEVAIGFRMRLILGSPGTPVSAFDQDSWVTSLHYDKRSPSQAIEHFRVAREANLSLLKWLSPGQWKDYGMHSERGKESMEHMVRLTAGHDLNHLRQIEQILGK